MSFNSLAQSLILSADLIDYDSLLLFVCGFSECVQLYFSFTLSQSLNLLLDNKTSIKSFLFKKATSFPLEFISGWKQYIPT